MNEEDQLKYETLQLQYGKFIKDMYAVGFITPSDTRQSFIAWLLLKSGWTVLPPKEEEKPA